MKNKISLLFICLLALFLPYPAMAIECRIIQYDADSYEAGDRVAELGIKPKVAVGRIMTFDISQVNILTCNLVMHLLAHHK